MAEETSIRFAAPADLEFLQPRTRLPAEIVRRKIEWQEVVVAERGDGLVGFLQLEYLWSAVPYVALIYVLPECRRQGAGHALLSFAEESLSGRGHDTLYSSSQVDEPEAQAWHRRAGFEECGVIAGINQGVGEVFFRKRLT